MSESGSKVSQGFLGLLIRASQYLHVEGHSTHNITQTQDIQRPEIQSSSVSSNNSRSEDSDIFVTVAHGSFAAKNLTSSFDVHYLVLSDSLGVVSWVDHVHVVVFGFVVEKASIRFRSND